MTAVSAVRIEAQLNRILTSSGFTSSQRLNQFLRYVVKQTLNGQADTIKQYTVAVEGMGFGAGFNPQSNPTVRIHARKLRRALDRYYLKQGSQDPIQIDIPKGSYVPVFKSNHDTAANTPLAPESICFDPSTIEPKIEMSDGPSIAVMQLEFLGNEPDHAFFASGITEELVIALTRFPEFLVIGSLDRDAIRAKHLGPRGIGQEYNVRFFLDGTVRFRGRSLRVSAKLTDTLSGRQLWGQSQDYDISSSSLEQVEHEIVSQIVTTIADNFGVIPRTLAKEILSHHNDSLSDYAAILRFHHHVRVLTETSLSEAIEAMEKVVQRDPDHDLALALLGDLISTPYWLGYTDDQYDLGRAIELGKKALALNPNSQPAHFTLAINYYLRFQKELCLKEIEQALRLNPNNANYLANSALFIMGTGQWEEGLALIGRAMRWNPHHPGWYHFVPFLYHYFRGEFKTALVDANGFNTPDFLWDSLIRAAVLGQLGRQAEASKAGDELLALVPDFATRGHSLIQRMVYRKKHAEMLLEGLHKAGVKV